MNFDELTNKALELAKQHADKVDIAADRLGDLAKSTFTGHDEQIDQAVRKAKDLIPGGE